MIKDNLSLTPYHIEQRLKLRNPIYLETAAYGHMGRTPQRVTKHFESPYNGQVQKEVELFTWEKLDLVKPLKHYLILHHEYYHRNNICTL